jgi:heavy metal sensor kinase
MSIRLRFTLWAAAIMLGILLTLSFGIHYMMERNLQDEMDQRVASVYSTLIANPDGYVDAETGRFISALQNPEPFASPGLYIQVLNANFVVVGQTDNLSDSDEDIPVTFELLEQNRDGEGIYFNERVADSDLRVYSRAVVVRNAINNQTQLAYIQVAESREPLQQTLKQLRTILITGTLFGTVLAAGAAWLVADAALRPLRRMAATARTIGGASDLSERIASPRTNDEVERLAETFNAMLDRLEVAFDSHRQFVADASHELRTPLTALRGNTDILQAMVREKRVDSQLLSESLGDIGSETDRMSRLVQDMLTLARADIGWSPELDEEIDLVVAVSEAVRIHRPLARDHDLHVDLPDEEVLVRGNADQMRQLLLILLDNARVHTPAGTSVTISVMKDAGQAVVEVTDSGPGFDPEHTQRIFDRFYRTDTARARASGGTGLGLAIARWIAEAHGGAIGAESVPGEGAIFRVRLPRVTGSEATRSTAAAGPARVAAGQTLPSSRT